MQKSKSLAVDDITQILTYPGRKEDVELQPSASTVELKRSFQTVLPVFASMPDW